MFDQTIGDTLALVNIAREAFGAPPLTELPDAAPGQSRGCLYYRALKDVGCTSVAGNTMQFNTERQASTVAALWGTNAQGSQVDTPASVRSVINRFDNHEVKHYDV